MRQVLSNEARSGKERNERSRRSGGRARRERRRAGGRGTYRESIVRQKIRGAPDVHARVGLRSERRALATDRARAGSKSADQVASWFPPTDTSQIAVAGAEKKFENFSGDAKTQPPARLGVGWVLWFFASTARRSPPATNRPRRVRRGVRRGRDGVDANPIGGDANPITARSVASRSRGRSRRVRAIPGSKADAGRSHPLSSHPPAPLSGSPHLRPATARTRVVARVARHREHALHAHRAVIARTHRAARGHRRRCRDQ